MSDENENEGILASLTKTIENNWRLLLVGVIILAIALNSSSSDNESSNESKNSPTPAVQTEQSKQTEESKPEEKTQTAEAKTDNAAQTKEPETTQPTSNGNTIAQIAAKSEGVTHLARRAVKEYAANANENLSAEQKIYAEDYLKKKIGSKKLAVGEKVEFSIEMIKQGIEKAKGLNEKQIKNLSKYVPLVKNLN